VRLIGCLKRKRLFIVYYKSVDKSANCRSLPVEFLYIRGVFWWPRHAERPGRWTL